MDTVKRIDLYLSNNTPDLSEGIFTDIKAAFGFYIDGISAIDGVSKEVKALAEKAVKSAEGKTDDEKRKIVFDFMSKAKVIVMKSKMHTSMKAGYIEGMDKYFGKRITKV